MSYLTALLAFSAIMLVLTTLATVVVEGLHKLMHKRAGDFDRMLTQLYENAIHPRLKSLGVEIAESSDEFVKGLMQNPAFAVAKKRWYNKVPVLKNVFDTSFQELTTRQFVEQFAQTEAASELKAKAQEEVAEFIGRISYDFERFGDAASDYFRRRATSLSLVVAFFLALGLNIDAFKLYRTLAADDTLTQNVIANVEVSKLETAYMQSLEKAGDEAATTIRQEYNDILEAIKAESNSLQAFGLPIGFEYFPYCGFVNEENRGDAIAVDQRCQEIPARSKLKIEIPLLGPALTWLARGIVDFRRRVFSSSAGYSWLFSISIAGGLIGLGSPFWFKTYRSIASMIPGVKLPDGTAERQHLTAKATVPTVETQAATSVSDAVPGAPRGISAKVVLTTGLSEADLYQAFINSSAKNIDD